MGGEVAARHGAFSVCPVRVCVLHCVVHEWVVSARALVFVAGQAARRTYSGPSDVSLSLSRESEPESAGGLSFSSVPLLDVDLVDFLRNLDLEGVIGGPMPRLDPRPQ